MSAHEQLIETLLFTTAPIYIPEAIREEHLANVYPGSKGMECPMNT